jgi:hypothetical protein
VNYINRFFLGKIFLKSDRTHIEISLFLPLPMGSGYSCCASFLMAGFDSIRANASR